MRPSLVPGFLEAAALNSKQYNRFAMFELGRGYEPADEGFSTERSLFAAAFYDRASSRFMDAANTADKLLTFLRLRRGWKSRRGESPTARYPRVAGDSPLRDPGYSDQGATGGTDYHRSPPLPCAG